MDTNSIEFDERVHDLSLVFTYMYLMYQKGNPVKESELIEFWDVMAQVLKTGEHPILDRVKEDPESLGIRRIESDDPPDPHGVFGEM